MLKTKHGYCHPDNTIKGEVAIVCNCGLTHPYHRGGIDEMDVSQHWNETSNQFVTTTEKNLPLKKPKEEMSRN